jgi:hypothetical protein
LGSLLTGREDGNVLTSSHVQGLDSEHHPDNSGGVART